MNAFYFDQIHSSLPLQVRLGPFSELPLHSVKHKVRKRYRAMSLQKMTDCLVCSVNACWPWANWMPGAMAQTEVKSRTGTA